MATMRLLLLTSLAAAVFSLPTEGDPTVPEVESRVIQALPRQLVDLFPLPFKYAYIDAQGVIVSSDWGSENTMVEIVGSPRVSDAALKEAENVIAKMIINMPSDVFGRLVNASVGAGVFTQTETLTVFTEYAYLGHEQCGTVFPDCIGVCIYTCTSDGRRYVDLPGIAGKLSVVVDNNLMCTYLDPYAHKLNLLVQEFGITVHRYGLSDETKANITSAFQAAKAAATWTLTSYAMSAEAQYFAVATTVFFGVEKDTARTGGMNLCGTNNTVCVNEMEGRNNLMSKDPALYDILSYVYTDNRPDLASELTICPESATVVGK